MASPTLVRRQLGRELRTLREKCGRTREDVAASRLMSRTKLENLEFGRVSVRPGDVYELCRLYGADEQDRDRLREMAVATNEPAWWQDHGKDLTRGFDTFLGLEAVASSCWVYEPAVVDGLLQTESYAWAVERATARADHDEGTIARLVRLRMGRQRELFDREQPLRLSVILGESALRLRVGDDDVRAEQHDRLREWVRADHLDVRVLPEAAGPHPGLLGGFRILDFADAADPSVVYVQSYVWARYNDRPDQVDVHRSVYRSLRDLSVSIEEYLS